MKFLRYACILGAVLALTACDDDSADTTTDAGSGSETDAGTGGDDATDETDTGSGVEEDVNTEPPCIYPVPGSIRTGEVLPDIIWSSAFDGDGNEFEFDLYDFYCDDETYGQYDTMVVVVSAGWCQFCPDMIRWVDALSERLEEEGGFILFVEAEDRQGSPINSVDAQDHFSAYAVNGSGVRVGDNSGGNQIRGSSIIQAFPTTFVVRRSDMVVVTDSTRSDYILPFVEIAMDPDADWSNPPPPEIVPEVPATCGPEDEEDSEPANNAPEGADTLTGPTSIEGGICDSSNDFFNIDIEGDWTVNLYFSHAQGDLDIYLWNPDTQQPFVGDGGAPVGSESTTDNETFSSTGPGILVVRGFNGGTATYTLEITAP